MKKHSLMFTFLLVNIRYVNRLHDPVLEAKRNEYFGREKVNSDGEPITPSKDDDDSGKAADDSILADDSTTAADDTAVVDNTEKTGPVFGPMEIEGGHIPWCWYTTREWFCYPRNSDSYLYFGYRSLPRTCSDYAGIINSDSDWEALTMFYDTVYKRENMKTFADHVSLLSANVNRVGARLFKTYFECIWKRAKRHEWINSTMRELQALPFQVFDAKMRLWPPPKKVSVHLLSYSCLTTAQGEERPDDGSHKVTVQDAKPTWDDFKEKMFGPRGRTCDDLEEVARAIYYHYWDNWTRHGMKIQSKRDDLKEDFDRALAAIKKTVPRSTKEAMDLMQNLMCMMKKYIDLECVYAGDIRANVLANYESTVETIVMSVKEKKGALSLVPRSADLLTINR